MDNRCMITPMTTMPGRAGIPDWTLGWRLQRALSFANIKVETIAEELGVARNTVSRWLNDRGPVREIYLKQWALRCGVDYRWLKSGKTSTPDGGNVMTDCSRLLDLDRYRERHIHAYKSHLALAG